ncbi:F0F1 ATP synthase subunit delta [Arcanobacterium hippocoleae]|uniref:ATP synthase subunit delta n=1 Tax=Arcanobacterium hippocoleae TaxID=149017 RepID=A0ABU1T3L6_9ACTO|nr:F0F1 ATP synthase subunit delta [Arcanobacterium hippocoleae]MDR6939981.1 F-type H+-transporting ATPase subunit delta [Arcanobacterium hippocoleae]
MRTGSEAALQQIGQMWEGVLRTQPGQEIMLARLIFDAADILRQHANLLGALEDRSRDANARAVLAREVFAAHIESAVLELVLAVVRENWSEPGDLIQALEYLGIDTVLLGAQREDLLSKTEEELYHAMRVLKKQRDLRLILNDTFYPRAERSKLVERVFAKVNPYTRFLISHAVRRTEHYSIAASLSLYVQRSAQHAKHLVAAVASAIPLSAAQEARLAQILADHYGKEIRLHTTIEPAVIGGLRIHVQDDVIDGTIATRLAAVKDLLKK